MSYAVGKAQEFSIIIMPGTVPTLEHAMKLRGTPFQKKLQDLAHANGIHIVTWWWTPGAFATKDREITGPKSVDGPEDARRRPDLRDDAEGGRRLGGQHAVDRDLPVAAVGCAQRHADFRRDVRQHAAVRADQVCDHPPGKYSLWMLLQPLVMSKQHWDKLTPAQQKIFEEAAAKSDEYFLGLQREAVSDMEKEYKKAGAQGARDDPGRVRPVGRARQGHRVEGVRGASRRPARTCSTRCSRSSERGRLITTAGREAARLSPLTGKAHAACVRARGVPTDAPRAPSVAALMLFVAALVITWSVALPRDGRLDLLGDRVLGLHDGRRRCSSRRRTAWPPRGHVGVDLLSHYLPARLARPAGHRGRV